jgi:hypothetical protein
MKKRTMAIVFLAVAVIGGAAAVLFSAFGSRHAESVNRGNYMASIGCGALT